LTCSHPVFEVWFDTDKLEKIIYNLLSNAFKFTPDDGEVSITLNMNYNTVDHPRQYQGTSRTEGIMYEIRVKDSGIGIPKEAQSKIFDRFYQVRNPITTQGTGIGLSLTYELVTLHKGTIHVTSEPNYGSEFSVLLPLWREEQPLPHSAAPKTKMTFTIVALNENS